MKRYLDTYRDPSQDGINLDGFVDATEVWGVAEIIRQHPIRVAQELFPAKPRGYVKATELLCHYAYNKGTAMACRSRGDIVSAGVYERICDNIADKLPDFARW